MIFIENKLGANKMSILLPPMNHPAREFVDVGHLAEVFAPENINLINSLSDAVFKARCYIDSNIDGVISVNVICNFCDEYVLLQVDALDSMILWNFTTGEI